MKKGDLYYLKHNPKSKALIMKTSKQQRKFHSDSSHYNSFPSISIIPCVEVMFVAGNRKGEKDNFAQEQFRQFFVKVEVEDESR
jgi:hypothetical protein